MSSSNRKRKREEEERKSPPPPLTDYEKGNQAIEDGVERAFEIFKEFRGMAELYEQKTGSEPFIGCNIIKTVAESDSHLDWLVGVHGLRYENPNSPGSLVDHLICTGTLTSVHEEDIRMTDLCGAGPCPYTAKNVLSIEWTVMSVSGRLGCIDAHNPPTSSIRLNCWGPSGPTIHVCTGHADYAGVVITRKELLILENPKLHPPFSVIPKIVAEKQTDIQRRLVGFFLLEFTQLPLDVIRLITPYCQLDKWEDL